MDEAVLGDCNEIDRARANALQVKQPSDMRVRSAIAPGLRGKYVVYALALFVFVLTTYARMSWYRADCLEKTYLVKAVKLMENRARVSVGAQAPLAAIAVTLAVVRAVARYWWPITIRPVAVFFSRPFAPARGRPPPTTIS